MATYNSYLEELKQTNPAAYNQAMSMGQYTANEKFGGQVQDYQAQIFSPLNLEKAGIPKQLEFTEPRQETYYDDNGNQQTRTIPPQVKNAGFTANNGENGLPESYSSPIKNVNGLPINANYDPSGKLLNVRADPNVVSWLNGNQYAQGQWDAQGNPVQKIQTSSGGGDFLKSIAPVAALAAAYFGGSAIADALGAGGAVGAESPFLSGMAEENAISGAGVAGSSGGSYGAGVAGSGAANAITPAVTTSGTPVSQVGNGSDFINGGTAGGVSGVAATEGAGVAGSTGGSYAAGAGALGAGTLGAGAAGATAAGTGLSSLLTPVNALLAKGVLDTVGSNKAISGINSAAATQQAAYEQSKKDLAGLYANQQGYQRPYMATGTNALSNLGALGTGTYQMYDVNGNPTGTGTGSGYLQHQFDASDLAKGLAPNYDFMLQQGQMANQRAANMAGGGLGGNALTGLNRYTQDYAGNAYQNAFTNYQNQRQNIFGNLSNLANLGQGATKDLTAATGAYGTNLTNLNVGNAAAQAAAQVAAAQQGGTNLSNLGNTAVVATLLNQNPGIAQTPVP